MQRANEKRQLEALVIAKGEVFFSAIMFPFLPFLPKHQPVYIGKFRMPGSNQRAKVESISEMAAAMLKLEGEKIEVVPHSEAGKAKVISDADLERLLDRNPEVFADRGKGWHSGIKKGAGDESAAGGATNGNVAFEVFEAPPDEGNDTLAAMMGEEIAE